MAAEKRDLYQRFELELRTPKTRLLLDAFLPAPATLESTVTPQEPPPLPVPEMTAEELNMYRRREPEEEEPPPEPKSRAKKKAAASKKKKDEAAAPKSLQDEIAEFMNRDGGALAPDEDLSALLNNALDPAADKDKKD